MFKTKLIHTYLIIIMIFSIGGLQAASKYTIIHESAKVRKDGGKNYYVLLKPVNLKNKSYKKDVEQMVREIASQKGREITIDFFDDRQLLEDYYQLQLKSVPKSENKTEVFHHIARFVDGGKGHDPVLIFIPELTSTNNDYGVKGQNYDFRLFNPYK